MIRHVLTNDCTWPLHPWGGYNKKRFMKGAPPEEVLYIFSTLKRGEWFWCPPCRKRNNARTRVAKERFVVNRRANKFDPWIRRRPHRMLGDRFASLTAQTNFARQHAPPGLFWCTWGQHYTKVEEYARTVRGRISKTLCQPCYKNYIQSLASFTLKEKKTRIQQLHKDIAALEAQKKQARQELADLKASRQLIANAALHLPASQREEDSDDSEIREESAPSPRYRRNTHAAYQLP